jgi:hypothetical protein
LHFGSLTGCFFFLNGISVEALQNIASAIDQSRRASIGTESAQGKLNDALGNAPSASPSLAVNQVPTSEGNLITPQSSTSPNGFSQNSSFSSENGMISTMIVFEVLMLTCIMCVL